MSELDLATLTGLVGGRSVAIRVQQRLQPAGGAGDKVFPPTYATGDNTLRYATETRRRNGQDVPVVLLDSVASQANRMEEALLAAWSRREIDFPVIGVDFSVDPDLADIGTLTALQTPHRIADAILRDATDESGTTLFRFTPEGRAFTEASVRNATAVYRLCPTALIFGVWDSTGPRGGLGAKFQRALTSEIVAFGASAGRKVESRIDPLAIQANVDVYRRKDAPDDWTIDKAEAYIEKGKPVPFGRKGKPSAVNHSNVAPTIDEFAGGITFDEALQTVVLSLPALRRLRFPAVPPDRRDQGELAARTALAALALAAIVHQRAEGYDLRSRCLLVPDGDLQFGLVAPDGAVTNASLSIAGANALVKEAAAHAAEFGLGWEREPVRLKPAPKLIALVKESRRLAAAGAEEAE
ncbi:MAG TPA: type I-U CRISPR-associated RAMP protein Csb1/Cas7u [Vicinamibacterales bacterium]